jgi:DNA-binding PadR family transcriptional regulator
VIRPGQLPLHPSVVLLLEDPQPDLSLNRSCLLSGHGEDIRARERRALWTLVPNQPHSPRHSVGQGERPPLPIPLSLTQCACGRSALTPAGAFGTWGRSFPGIEFGRVTVAFGLSRFGIKEMADRRTSKEVPLDGKSPIRAAVLAALIEAPGHGWDVARRASLRMGSSWRVEPKHVYPYLKRLETAGLVRTEREPSQRPPYVLDVYYPTEKGEQARREWLAARPTSSAFRTDLHVRLAFSNEEDIADLLRALAERRLDILEEIEENAANQTARVSYVGTIISLQCSAVDRRLKAEMEWIEEARAELEARREKRSRE